MKPNFSIFGRRHASQLRRFLIPSRAEKLELTHCSFPKSAPKNLAVSSPIALLQLSLRSSGKTCVRMIKNLNATAYEY